MTDLKRQRVGASKCPVVGVLDWHSSEEPTAASVRGSSVLDQGLTRIQLFIDGGYQVVGSCAVGHNPWPSNFGRSAVGTTHKIWGWQAAARKVDTPLRRLLP